MRLLRKLWMRCISLKLISKLKEDLNNNNQWLRLNNVKIMGVALKNKENLFEIVSKIDETQHKLIYLLFILISLQRFRHIKIERFTNLQL